jgi:hypothetical protein
MTKSRRPGVRLIKSSIRSRRSSGCWYRPDADTERLLRCGGVSSMRRRCSLSRECPMTQQLVSKKQLKSVFRAVLFCAYRATRSRRPIPPAGTARRLPRRLGFGRSAGMDRRARRIPRHRTLTFPSDRVRAPASKPGLFMMCAPRPARDPSEWLVAIIGMRTPCGFP